MVKAKKTAAQLLVEARLGRSSLDPRVEVVRLMGLKHVDVIWQACQIERVSFGIGAVLFSKETGGEHVWGRSDGPPSRVALSGFPGPVNEDTFRVFTWMREVMGLSSNGVGLGQITWEGWFDDMEKKGLKVWLPLDNARETLQILRVERARTGSLEAGFNAFNGDETGAYGRDCMARLRSVREAFRAVTN
jgi:hypothetical protein